MLGNYAPVALVGTPSRPPKWIKPQLTLRWMPGPPGLAAEMMRPYGGAIDIWEVGKMSGRSPQQAGAARSSAAHLDTPAVCGRAAALAPR